MEEPEKIGDRYGGGWHKCGRGKIKGGCLVKKSKMYSITAGRTHSPLMCAWETLTLPDPPLNTKGPLVLTSLFLMPVSRWWPHNACWKMSSGHVREAIWLLIDGSRRATAAMFSDITTCRLAMPGTLSEKRWVFFLLCLLPQYISLCFCQYFGKKGEKLGMQDYLSRLS